MTHHILIVEVQLDQLKMAFPAFIPKAVVIAVVSAEVDVEPVAVRGGFPIFQHILEGPEAASHMVEHAVQHNADAVFVQLGAQGGKAFVGAQAAVNHTVIARIIAVAVALEDGAEVNRVHAQIEQVRDPLLETRKTGLCRCGAAVVVFRRAAEAERINLIKIAFICPHG